MSDSDCVVEGCSRAAIARGYCSRHWAQWRRSGTATSAADRTCALSDCGASFVPKRSDQRYCCGPHASRGWREERGTYRPEVRRLCALDSCDEQFVAYRNTQRFCSKRCYAEYRRSDPAYRAENAARMRERYRSDPQVRVRARLGRYGLTEQQYARMFSDQGERCAICRSPDPRGDHWHIDHDHVTGRVRGILCGFCNPAIGYFADDPDRLLAAVEYIQKHRG